MLSFVKLLHIDILSSQKAVTHWLWHMWHSETCVPCVAVTCDTVTRDTVTRDTVTCDTLTMTYVTQW